MNIWQDSRGKYIKTQISFFVPLDMAEWAAERMGTKDLRKAARKITDTYQHLGSFLGNAELALAFEDRNLVFRNPEYDDADYFLRDGEPVITQETDYGIRP